MGYHFCSLENVSQSVLLQDFTTLKHHSAMHATQHAWNVMVLRPGVLLVALMTIFTSLETNA